MYIFGISLLESNDDHRLTYHSPESGKKDRGSKSSRLDSWTTAWGHARNIGKPRLTKIVVHEREQSHTKRPPQQIDSSCRFIGCGFADERNNTDPLEMNAGKSAATAEKHMKRKRTDILSSVRYRRRNQTVNFFMRNSLNGIISDPCVCESVCFRQGIFGLFLFPEPEHACFMGWNRNGDATVFRLDPFGGRVDDICRVIFPVQSGNL